MEGMKEEKQAFVNNGKISSRQTMRLYVFDLMGIATLLLPPYLAILCGANGIYAILIGTGCGFVFLLYLGWIMKKMGTDMGTYLNAYTSPWMGKLIFGWILFHGILTAGFCAYVFTNLMEYSLVQDTPYFLILSLIVFAAAYAVSGGIESRARVYEVLFWFILVPYIAMMLASVRNLKWRYIAPVLQWDSTNLGKGIYLVFLLLTPLYFSLFLIGEKEKNYGRNIVKTVAVSIALSGIILLGSFVLLLGNFGVESLANQRFPVITLMSTIQFEGNFLKRMDALMLAVWFFTLFALVNLHLHYAVRMTSELLKNKQEKPPWKRVVVISAIVYFVAYGMHLKEALKDLFLAYYSYMAIPFMMITPILPLLLKKRED